MRNVEQRVDDADSAMLLLRQWVAAAATPCVILPPSADSADVLAGLQVTTRSVLGAIAHETGGLLIDGGWLRILGSGNAGLPRDLLSWNRTSQTSGYLLVADDAVGGFFALNGGGLGEDLGALYYFAPDSTAWEALDIGYADFVAWALTDQLAQFYESLRWEGWQRDLEALGTDRCFAFYPFLWTTEGSVETSVRSTVPVAEQRALCLGEA